MRCISRLLLQTSFPALMCVVAVVCVAELVSGQDSTTPARASETSSPDGSSAKKEATKGGPKSAADAALGPTKRVFLQTKQGELVEVPADALYEKFREFIEKQGKPTGPPPATITNVEIAGTADEDRANLKVAFTILLNQADEFVSVPLGLNEASLRNSDYKGDGEEQPNLDKKEADQGIVWWLKGRGSHRLELTISVPLLKQLPSRRLVLSLPASPVRKMQLTLPYSGINPKLLPEQAVVSVKSAGDGKTVVEAFGLGSKLDLTWQPNLEVRPNEIALESQVAIRAQIEPDRVVINAEQQVKSFQSSFDQLVVRLPAGADSVKLDDSERMTYKLDPANRQRVIISMNEKSNAAQLTWQLHLPTKSPTTLVIDGFNVEGARKQVGKIGLSIAEGLRISEPRDPTLQGINVGEFPVALGHVSRAWQFLNQPFRMSTSIDEVKPYFQVKPSFFLTANAQYLSLEGDFEFRVDRDSLNEVVLTWPGQRSEGWTIEAVDKPGIVETYSVDEKGQITARLVKHFAGKFSVHMRARRSIKAGEETTFSVPRPKAASRVSPTSLVLVNAENVDTDLTARGETVFHVLPSSLSDPLSIPEHARGLKATTYRIDTDEQSFALRVIPQKQRIRTESFTEAHWQDHQFQLVQRITYDVSYERLSQVRLVVPSSVDLERVRFFAGLSNREAELTRDTIAPIAGELRQVQLNLGEAQLGRFEIQARFSLPFKDTPSDADSVVDLPIFVSSDEQFSKTTVSLTQSDGFDAEPVLPEMWKPQLNRQEAWQWMAEGAQPAISLKLVRSSHVNGTGSVSRALVTVSLDGTGSSAVRAQFRISTRADSMPVVLPASASSPSFFWNNRRLSDRDCVESPAGSRRYTIQLPESPEGRHASASLLTIDYLRQFDEPMTWSAKLELEAPALPTCSWAQVVWQAVLPPGQNMLTYPATATPMFRWQRTGLLWRRVSTPDSERLQQWVAAGVPSMPPVADALFSEKTGNLYSFSQFDSPRTLQFQTLSSSMVLLFGAGFSLAVGFLMFRITMLRHVLTLLVVGVIVAVVGLWYSAPLELLFQPMMAGLVFPAVAVFLEGWVRRRYDSSSLSFEGQAEFPPMTAFGNQYVVRQSDPNEATLHRPAARESDSGLRVESGSGVS